MAETNRIKFALYSKAWTYDTKDIKTLRGLAREVPAAEYLPEMKGYIFCPECCVPLFRSPEGKEYSTNGRKAFYSHSRKHQVFCSLRVKQAEGKRYENEEQAQQAIEDGELVIVRGFMREKPVPPDVKGPVQYQGPIVEDIEGGLTEVAIGRHDGEEFKLPSRITTIRGLCRNFDKNLYRYFFFPSQVAPILLQDLLVDIRRVDEVNDKPRLYYGRISSSRNMGKTPNNIRQTFFEYPKNYKCPDFCLKVTDQESQEHGIDDESKGKIVLMYGKVIESGVGLCLARLGWGEFAVLPDKYIPLLEY
tara:strand:- start:527580 stop:528494 length:915 start_codon:yes stop_codon:yes gene_type:complete